MSRFLFSSFPVTGHINPGLPIARELVARGHEVRWHSTPRFRRAIEATGAKYLPYRHARIIDEERVEDLFPDRPRGGVNQLRFDIKRIFLDAIPGVLLDLEDELARDPYDVIVGDATWAACGVLRERHGIPWAAYGISVLALPSRDTAPFGLALNPSSTTLGRLRNRLLEWFTDRIVFGDANAHFQKIRRELGMQPFRRSVFDYGREADLYLQGGTPSFEYPRTDLPAQLRFIGASMPAPPANWAPPAWWSELDAKRVVLVTQGTINNDYDQLIRPAIRALANEDVFVVVTTGTKSAESVGIDPLPPNVRVEQFVPYAHLMPKVDLLLTNGGYGTVQIALMHGVPIVAIGKTEEKPEIANRVAWSGVGVGIKVLVPTEEQIAGAVRKVLDNPYYRARAEAVRYELAQLGAARRGAELLEELAGSEDDEEMSRTA